MAAKKEQFFALWKYDRFPYVLGGHVATLHNDGTIETTEYGVGYRFRPFAMVPAKIGRNLIDTLEILSKDYGKEKVALNEKYTKLRDDVLREHGLKDK